MKKKRYFSRGVMFLLSLIFAVMFLLPTVLTITNSFMSEEEIKSNYGMIFSTTSGGYVSKNVNLKFIPDKVTLSQYISGLIKTPDYLVKLWNSILLVVPIVLLQVGVASIAAYSFTRWRGKIRSGIFFFYVILMLMPYQVTLVPNYLVSSWLGILNTRWSIILPGMFAPFSVFLLTKFMRRIPYSLIEAAKVDGAGEWDIFTKICLPECRSALYSIAILVFIDYWNMVEQPLILLQDADSQPLSVFLSQINAGEIGLAFAMATVYMIPSLLLFLHGEEYLVEGIANSAPTKGVPQNARTTEKQRLGQERRDHLPRGDPGAYLLLQHHHEPHPAGGRDPGGHQRQHRRARARDRHRPGQQQHPGQDGPEPCHPKRARKGRPAG